MHKYTGKTYSKARKRDVPSATIFDVVQNAESSRIDDDTSLETSTATFRSSIPKKTSWSRVQKAVVHVQKNSPTKDAAKGSKKPKKLDTIDEDDPFAFTDDDVQGPLPSSQNSSQKTLDPCDKSTDDEAYSSSQECSETSSKSSQQSSKRSKRTSPIVSSNISRCLFN